MSRMASQTEAVARSGGRLDDRPRSATRGCARVLLDPSRDDDVGGVKGAVVVVALPDPDRTELSRVRLIRCRNRVVLDARGARTAEHDVRGGLRSLNLQRDLHDERWVARKSTELCGVKVVDPHRVVG